MCGLCLGAQVVAGDVTNPDSLVKALEGCRAVVFAAAAKTYWAANEVDHLGVLATAVAAKAAGCERVVMVSSMYVDPSKFGWKPIRMILNKVRWRFMDAKFAGEQALRSHGIDYCIVRPGGLDHGLKPEYQDHVVILPRDSPDMPAGSRSVWRADVATVVGQALVDPAASRTTIEVVARLQHADDPPLEERNLFEGVQPDP
jgi:uncharacterized protein YbjT (DUF2867 family)